MNYQHIPVFGRAEEAWKNHLRFAHMDGTGSQPTVRYHRTNDFHEAIHVLSAEHGVTSPALSGIHDATASGFPEGFNRRSGEFIERWWKQIDCH